MKETQTWSEDELKELDDGRFSCDSEEGAADSGIAWVKLQKTQTLHIM